MRLLFIGILIACLLYIFLGKRSKKLAVFCVAYMLLGAVSIGELGRFGSATRLVAFCFFLSELPYLSEYKNALKDAKVLLIVLGFTCVYALMTILHSPHIGLARIPAYLYNYFIVSYFVLFYGYVGFRNKNTMVALTNCSFWCMVVLTIVAIINIVAGNNIVINAITGTVYKFTAAEGINSLCPQMSDYGFFCVLFLIWHIFAYRRGLESKPRLYLMVVMCLLGIIACNARTVIMCTMVCAGVYVLSTYKTRVAVFGFIAIFILAIFAYTFITPFQEIVNNAFTVFDSDYNEAGRSSSTMRLVQLLTVLLYIQNNLAFGLGQDYFYYDMNWGKGEHAALLDNDLHGLEGVYLMQLFEHGIVGYVLYLLTFLTILIYLVKSRKINKTYSGMALCVWFLYAIYANMTGELGSLEPSLLFLGIFIKLIHLESNNRIAD